MRLGRTLAFVMVALLAGGILSQLPSAMADDSDNPFGALWDAIFDLQNRDDALQAQIDELRAERNALLVQTGEPALVSNLYASIEVEAAEDGHTLVHITAGNNGPDRAAAVKLTAFYLLPLFEINSIDGDLCLDKSRGIIECVVGTLEEGQEFTVTIDATARESGTANTWTVDVSTTTGDSDYSDNHVTYDFETGSGERVDIPQVEQPAEEEEPAAEQEESEQDVSEPANNTVTEEPQESTANQTSAEPETPNENQTLSETVEDAGSNGTSAETESTENQPPANTEETVDESGSSGTESEESEQAAESSPEEQEPESSGSSEEGTADEAPEESSEEPEDAGEEASAPQEDASENEEPVESESSEES